MQGEAANRILDAAAKCAGATQALFDALDRRTQGELTPDEAITVAQDYCVAKEEFDSAVMTRGVVQVELHEMTNVQAKRAFLLQMQEARRWADELMATTVEFLTEEEVAVLHARGALLDERLMAIDDRIEETNPVLEASE